MKKGTTVSLFSLVVVNRDGKKFYEINYFPCTLTGEKCVVKNHTLYEVQFGSGFKKFSDEGLLDIVE